MGALTVIIPFLKETPTELFEETLASVLEYRPSDVDILVVNAAGYDDCWQIQDEEGVYFLHVDSEANLIQLINMGIAESKTPIIQPILCGGTVYEGWAETALSHFQDEKTAAVIPVILEQQDLPETASEDDLYKTHRGFIYTSSGELLPLPANEQEISSNLAAPHLGGCFFRRVPLLDLGLLDENLSSQIAYIDMAFLLHAIGQKIDLDKNVVISYLPGSLNELSPLQIITGQELLFWRWNDGEGKNTKTSQFVDSRLHSKRVFREYCSAFFTGQLGKLKAAYKAGQIKTAGALRKKKIAQAKNAMLTRQN